jgi:hypothetical protein
MAQGYLDFGDGVTQRSAFGAPVTLMFPPQFELAHTLLEIANHV